MMRWWWFGPELEPSDIDRQLDTMVKAGIGGVELAFVYPLATVTHPFLSEGCLERVGHAARSAAERGLRFDLTLGSGWPFGGPWVETATAARRLRWETHEIDGRASRIAVPNPRWAGDELLAAYIGEGTQQEAPATFVRIAPVDGTLDLPPAGGPRLVLLVWSAITGQQVKRAAAGAEGHALDHYSERAVREHLTRVGEPLLAAAGAEHVTTVFCDSLEVYDADYTPALADAFRIRWSGGQHDERSPEEASERVSGGTPQRDAGPDEFLDNLWLLRFDGAGADRFRSAYFEALADLFDRHFLRVMHEWAAERGVAFRVQNYGVPPTRLSSYRYADGVEGEGWGWRGLPQTRWAASAEHRLHAAGLRDESSDGSRVVSSETWTWVHSPSLRATPLDLLGEAHEHFLLGVNQLVGHGWPASPAAAAGIGRLFYASGALDDRNAWWAAMPGLAGYLARASWVLRHGAPVADVTLLLPTADVHRTLAAASPHRLDLWRACRDHIGDEIPGAIRDAGFDFDCIDGELIAVTDPALVAETGPVVLPFVSRVSDGTRRWLEAVVRAGGTVLRVQQQGAPAMPDPVGEPVALDDLEQTLRRLRPPDLRIEPRSPDIGFVHRRLDDGDLYFVANTGTATRSVRLFPRARHRSWQRWDAWTGAVDRAGDGTLPLALELAPYEAAFLVLGDELPSTTAASDPAPLDTALALGGATNAGSGWTVTFPGESPTTVSLPHDWTAARPTFAGTAVYSYTFDADTVWSTHLPSRVVLDFGPALPSEPSADGATGIRGSSYRALVEPPIREIARVVCNDEAFPVVMAPPYRLDITTAIKPGRNRVQIAVSNASAAVLGDPDVQEALLASIAAAEAEYGVRFRMQDLAAASEGLQSGLVTVPVLRWASR